MNKPPKPKQKRGRKSLKDLGDEAEFVELPSDEVLSKKLYYSIGEVCDLFQINPSSIRYWETEFSFLKPRKNKKGDRFFNATEVKKVHQIYYLLRYKKYTIEAAKDYLKQHKNDTEVRFELIKSLQQIKQFLLALKADL
nr:MerR family transcriptional regulator [uncultured Lacibacter sp.]